MDQVKIYIRMIDGTDTLVPVKAEQVSGKCYRILNDEKYSDPDPSVLFQFYPGDIVEVDDTEDIDNDYQYTAKCLIEPAETNDRDYFDFQFHATLRLLPITKQIAERFKAVLERIKDESIEGTFSMEEYVKQPVNLKNFDYNIWYAAYRVDSNPPPITKFREGQAGLVYSGSENHNYDSSFHPLQSVSRLR